MGLGRSRTPSKLESALTGLDPAERALLDLSLRQDFSDAKLAELSGTNEPAIASWRKSVIFELAEAADIDTAGDRADVEAQLRAAPASAWLSSASEPTKARSRRRARLLGVALALVAAIVVVVLIAHGSSGTGSSTPVASGAGDQGGQSPPPTTTAAQPATLAPLPGGQPGATASAQLTGTDKLDVKVTGLPNPGDGAYRLWLFDSVIHSKPVGALTSGSGTIHAKLPANASSYHYLDVTRESSPTDDTYSGLVVLRTPVSKVEPR